MRQSQPKTFPIDLRWLTLLTSFFIYMVSVVVVSMGVRWLKYSMPLVLLWVGQCVVVAVTDADDAATSTSASPLLFHRRQNSASLIGHHLLAENEPTNNGVGHEVPDSKLSHVADRDRLLHPVRKRSSSPLSSSSSSSSDGSSEDKRAVKLSPSSRPAANRWTGGGADRLMRDLGWKRGALERNFLRFGRGGSAVDGPRATTTTTQRRPRKRSVGYAQDDDDGRQEDKRGGGAALDRNFLRFGRRHLQDPLSQDVDVTQADDPSDRNLVRRAHAMGARVDDAISRWLSEGRNDGGGKRTPPMDRNFLRFGRSWATAADGGGDDVKRTALDRNFLRFGKRTGSAQQRHAKQDPF